MRYPRAARKTTVVGTRARGKRQMLFGFLKGIPMLCLWLSLSELGSVSAFEAGGDLADLQAESVAIRRQTARLLGQVESRSAVPALMQALRDADESVRREAAKSLGKLKDRRSVPSLIHVLRDEDMNVRFYAAYALGEIKDPRAIDVLIHALDDPQWCVRDQAAWALKEINDPSLVPLVVAMFRKSNADIKHLSWILQHVDCENTAQQVATLLEDPQRSVRLRAVAVLGRLPNSTSVKALIQSLDDEDAAVRKKSIAMLCQLRDKRAVAALNRLLAREQLVAVRQAARQAAQELSRHEALVAHWSFDQPHQTRVQNELRDDNHGQILGCQPVPGISGKALEFRGQQYIEFGQPTGLPMAGVPFTVTAWIKTTADNGVVIARGGAFCGFSLYLKQGVPAFGIHRLAEGPAYIARGTDPVTRTWVYLAGVVNEQSVQLFVNGKLAGATQTPGYIPGNCGQGMEIGFDVANSPAELTDHFQGVIDEVKIYAAALSPDELVEQFRAEQHAP